MQYSISLRPRKFTELFGQPSIVRELEKRKEKKNWPSAILLKGSSGTGKSSTCQIIAMTINCQHPLNNGDPCCECSSCKSILEERFDRNTIRIDGGQTSKGEIVNFLDIANISPMYDNKNIIIIEEADQLSKEAKASLLKVLEKPQTSTHFILLSMYNTGLPPEIQSRCQVYNFKSFTTVDVMFALKGSLEKLSMWEDTSIPKSFKIEGIKTLAEASNGSLRAGIQYLEKCLIGEYWTPQEIRENLGIVDYTVANNLLQLLLDKNPQFIDEFDKVDIQEFFNYTYTILSATYSHKISNYMYVRDEFEVSTRKLGEHSNLLEVLHIFDTVYSSSTYLKKSFLLSKLSQFIASSNIPKLSNVLNNSNNNEDSSHTLTTQVPKRVVTRKVVD